jgi:hypothetical protein
MSPNDWLTFAIVLAMFLGLVAGAIAYVINRCERVRDNLNRRIDTMAEQFMRRDDAMEHLTRIEASVDRVHERLDGMLQTRS